MCSPEDYFIQYSTYLTEIIYWLSYLKYLKTAASEGLRDDSEWSEGI